MRKRLKLRWPAVCASCGAELPGGTQASWDTDRKSAFCIACDESGIAPVVDPAPEGRVAVAGITEPPPPPPPTPGPAPVERGEAGASARREYERRSRRELEKKQERIEADREWRRQVKAKVPVLGHVAAALTPKPTIGPESQATKAWKDGEDGERRVAEILEDCDVIALHDRRVPRSPANIDHIAVGPAGIFVIDAKKYTGRIEKRDVGGFFKVDERLYVRGRDRTKLVAAVHEQCAVVRAALGDEVAPVPVRGILCFVGAEWPGLRMKPITVDGVTSVWPRGLPKLVESTGPLDRQAIEDTARLLAAVLRPA